MPPVTNLTELWQDNEKNDALLLTAKPTAGADYAIFRALCEAFSFMQNWTSADCINADFIAPQIRCQITNR